MVDRFTGSAFDPQGPIVRYSDYADLERENAELRFANDTLILAAKIAAERAAEAENARLRALPLKDEVERLKVNLTVMRTADIVYHEPSEEKWVVAWADSETGYMAPCGWPTCRARIEDCRIVTPATDEQSAALVKILSTSGRTDADKAAEIAGRQALTSNGRGE